MNDADSTFFSAAVEPTVTVFEPALVPIGQRAGPLHTGDRHVSAIDPPVLCHDSDDTDDGGATDDNISLASVAMWPSPTTPTFSSSARQSAHARTASA